MAASASRRALLGSIAALPALSLPGLASAPKSSDIVRQCVFAIEHSKWIDRTCVADEGWPEEKMSEEMERYWTAFHRADDQASTNLAEVKAKARLALHDMTMAGELENANPGLWLAKNVLEEIIALGA